MVSRRLRFLSTLAAGLIVVSACQATPGASTSPTGGASACAAGAGTGVQIPDVQAGKFNVAMVLIGPHDDAGWSQAQQETERVTTELGARYAQTVDPYQSTP